MWCFRPLAAVDEEEIECHDVSDGEMYKKTFFEEKLSPELV